MSFDTLAVLDEIEPINLETPTAQLVAAARLGDREAFGLLAERYRGAVYRAAVARLGNDALAEELCQDVFLHAMTRLDQLRDDRCFGGWVRRMAANMAINLATRRVARSGETFAALENTADGRPTPLASIVGREELAELRRGLDRLGALDRETLLAFYVEESSLLEMSTRFDAPVGTIKRRLHVARKRLAATLREPACA